MNIVARRSKTVSHLMLDADPYTPDGWHVKEHRRGGALGGDPSKISLYVSTKQQHRRGIVGDKLREELKDQPVYNANMLDYYLAHPHLIPRELKGKRTYFWGTIYGDSDGNSYVRSLDSRGDKWSWSFHSLGNTWHDIDPAAVLPANQSALAA